MSEVINITDYFDDYKKVKAMFKTDSFILAYIDDDLNMPIVIGEHLDESQYAVMKHYIELAWDQING